VAVVSGDAARGWQVGREEAGPQALYVLIHVDVATFELKAVGDWLKAVAEPPARRPGPCDTRSGVKSAGPTISR